MGLGQESKLYHVQDVLFPSWKITMALVSSAALDILHVRHTVAWWQKLLHWLNDLRGSTERIQRAAIPVYVTSHNCVMITKIKRFVLTPLLLFHSVKASAVIHIYCI